MMENIPLIAAGTGLFGLLIAMIRGIFSIMVFTYVVPPTGGLYLIRIVGTRPYGAVIQAYF